MFWPCETRTSTCRNFATISSGVYRFFGIAVLLHVKRHSSGRTTSKGEDQTRYRRYQRPLSLLMMDIDFFKSINDRFGHDAGDKVIAGVANVCITTARSTDLLGRLGGEELALLLPETDLRSATHVAERLRLRIVEETIRVGGEWIPVTASIGVAEASLTVGSFLDLMKRADAALYAAKRNGRNRVEVMSPELEESMIDE